MRSSCAPLVTFYSSFKEPPGVLRPLRSEFTPPSFGPLRYCIQWGTCTELGIRCPCLPPHGSELPDHIWRVFVRPHSVAEHITYPPQVEGINCIYHKWQTTDGMFIVHQYSCYVKIRRTEDREFRDHVWYTVLGALSRKPKERFKNTKVNHQEVKCSLDGRLRHTYELLTLRFSVLKERRKAEK